MHKRLIKEAIPFLNSVETAVLRSIPPLFIQNNGENFKICMFCVLKKGYNAYRVNIRFDMDFI